MSDDNVVRLDEVVEKPLSDDIIDGMHEDTEDQENYLLFLFDVNPMQVNLITRMLKTLKVEAMWTTEEAMEKLEKENHEE